MVIVNEELDYIVNEESEEIVKDYMLDMDTALEVVINALERICFLRVMVSKALGIIF